MTALGCAQTVVANLNDDPDHDHPDRIDPRWSALEGLVGGDDSDRS